MSTRTIIEIICDICGSNDVTNLRHYEITLKRFSTIDGNYIDSHRIHMCQEHETDNIPLYLLFDDKTKADS